MDTKTFWKKDWFTALVLSLLFALLLRTPLMQGLERFAYDFGLRGTAGNASDAVAVLAIDDKSLGAIGRWPWPRAVHAEMIEILAAAGAKVIGHTAFFFEPQVDPGLTYLQELEAYLQASGLVSVEQNPGGPLNIGIGDELNLLRADIAELSGADTALENLEFLGLGILGIEEQILRAIEALDGDAALAGAMARAGNVVIPAFLSPGQPLGNPDSELPPYMAAQLLDLMDAGVPVTPLPSLGMAYPIDLLGTMAAGVGHLTPVIDVDGGVRNEALIMDYFGAGVPSLALVLAAQTLNLDLADIEVTPGPAVRMGNLDIRTDDRLAMGVFYYRDRQNASPFPIYSFSDIY